MRCSFGSQQLPGIKTEHVEIKNALKRGSLLTLDSMLIYVDSRSTDNITWRWVGFMEGSIDTN